MGTSGVAEVLLGELPEDGVVEDVHDGHETATAAPVLLKINDDVH